jgi:hypothetical protein
MACALLYLGLMMRTAVWMAACVGAIGCSSTPSAQDGTGLEVIGQVIDFQTGQPVSGGIGVSTHGLLPQPTVTISPPAFVLDGVTPNSVFYALASADGHRASYSAAIVVNDADVDNVDVRVVSETYLAQLAAAFGVTPTAANGVLFAQMVDDHGAGLAGVPATALATMPGARGPYFLDAQLAAAPTATATTSSGWVVYFEVAPGDTGLVASATGTYTIDMPTSPIAAATVTVATVRAAAGAIVLPKNISFTNQVTPVFQRRGCAACHSGNGPGKDLANLTLDGSTNLVFKELMDPATTSTVYPRVDLATPEKSLVLTMPSAESPPDAHPNVTFTGPTDPDYLTILVWIREGAKQN